MLIFLYSFFYGDFRVYQRSNYVCSFDTEAETRDFCEWHNNDTENTRTDSSYNTDEPEPYTDADSGL